MQLYSLIDAKGYEARWTFDYDRHSWDGSAGGYGHAERVLGWARQHGIELDTEVAQGRVALHCPLAGSYWMPGKPELKDWLDEIRVLKRCMAALAAGHE